MTDIDLYRDREQSFIKHQFLTKYLELVAYKTLQVRSPVFNFIDAFAGPWRISDAAKYSDASFDQAINTLEAVRIGLEKRSATGIRIRFFLCEKRPEAVEKLREYAKSKGQFDIFIFKGAFEDNLSEISQKIQTGFTFTFIDPTGWNIRSEDVFRFLRQQKGEFMLNFMSDHINRHATYHEVASSFGRFLADTNWSDDFESLPFEWTNEQRMLHLLKAAMRKHKVANYLPDFSIMLPRQERLKMRLILGTHNVHGLRVFRDVQGTVEKQEIELRHGIRQVDSPQPSLWPTDEIVRLQAMQKGVGGRESQNRAEELIIDFLKASDFAIPDDLYSYVMEEVPIRWTQLNNLLKDMQQRKLVTYNLPRRRSVPQADTKISLV